jgi:hypothetical protein
MSYQNKTTLLQCFPVKKVLVLFYSQAGQTQKAVETFVRGFSSELKCDVFQIHPRETFPFPWTVSRFFRIFPRSIQGLAPEIEPLKVQWENYDLVILGYQVWFLSPSLPIQGFLKSPDAENLRGKKVITILTCRNLWYSASAWIQERLKVLGAHSLGQVTLCDVGPILASFITTPRWMLTGRKEPFAIFPAAGISDSEFSKLEAKGRKFATSWIVSNGEFVALTELTSNLTRWSQYWMDQIGHRFFKIWAPTVLTLAPREGLWQDFLLVLFRLSLVLLIISVAPLLLLFEYCVKTAPQWLKSRQRRSANSP